MSLRHSSGTHATKLQTRHSTRMDRVSCLHCSVAKLEHFLAKSVNHFVYMYVKRAILRTLYTTLGISRVQYFIRTCIVEQNTSCTYVLTLCMSYS